MATFKSRLPSSNEILLAFVAVVFSIHLQAFIAWMIAVPSLIKRYTLWDTLGVIAYTHVFVLLESIAALVVLILFSIILPTKFYRSHFGALSSIFIFITVPFSFVINLYLKFRVIKLGLFITLLIYITLVSFFWWLIKKYNKVNKFINNLSKILTPLSLFYVSFDVVMVFILVIRIVGR